MTTVEVTTVAMTYNLWSSHWWPQREAALRAFFATRAPDILAVQELRPETRDVLDEVLPQHVRVDDEFAGWAWESNIWWRASLFELDGSGAEDVGIRSDLRRLFWVRLRPRTLDDTRVLVATAHFTWPGHKLEQETGVNPRVGEAEHTVAALNRLAGENACIFLGDLNDHHYPVRIFRDAGMHDCFSVLGQVSPFTAPVAALVPADGQSATDIVPRVIDYQFHRGPLTVRTAEVADFFYQQTSPSDHKPVIATYTLYPRGT